MASALNLGDRDPLAGIGAPGDQDLAHKREGEPRPATTREHLSESHGG
jgi:hypothetical protein